MHHSTETAIFKAEDEGLLSASVEGNWTSSFTSQYGAAQLATGTLALTVWIFLMYVSVIN